MLYNKILGELVTRKGVFFWLFLGGFYQAQQHISRALEKVEWSSDRCHTTVNDPISRVAGRMETSCWILYPHSSWVGGGGNKKQAVQCSNQEQGISFVR